MKSFFTVLGMFSFMFALTSKFVGDILKDVITWLY